MLSRRSMERATIEGESPVSEKLSLLFLSLSTTGHGKSCGNPPRPRGKAKYFWRPIVDKYREGKVKRTPGGE